MDGYAWQKSSYSTEGANCVHVAAASDGTIRLRESDAPDAVLSIAPGALRGLLAAIKGDRLGCPAKGRGGSARASAGRTARGIAYVRANLGVDLAEDDVGRAQEWRAAIVERRVGGRR
ncbi:DUF397 domain-containing protein [Streptomyces varsoviensis]|uniref:DUF397 domain-containing protein n=1 Tax=Streptomyces varsoviensis TaxID=67373 RepID=UPI0033F74097